jgi:hypothetical protein
LSGRAWCHRGKHPRCRGRKAAAAAVAAAMNASRNTISRRQRRRCGLWRGDGLLHQHQLAEPVRRPLSPCEARAGSIGRGAQPPAACRRWHRCWASIAASPGWQRRRHSRVSRRTGRPAASPPAASPIARNSTRQVDSLSVRHPARTTASCRRPFRWWLVLRAPAVTATRLPLPRPDKRIWRGRQVHGARGSADNP